MSSDSSPFGLFDLNLSGIETSLRPSELPIHGAPEMKTWLVFSAVDQRAIEKEELLETTYGYKLKHVMMQAGIKLNDLHICTVNPEPVGNFHIARHYRATPDLVQEFFRKVDKYKPDLLIVVGEAGLSACTHESGIDKWRGSFIPSLRVGTSCLPVMDPFRLYFEEEFQYITQIDLKKIAVKLGGYQEPKKRYTIKPTFQEAWDYLEYLEKDCLLFSCDIETINNTLSCIGFSDAENEAVVIPFYKKSSLDKHYWSEEQELLLMSKIATVLGNPRSAKIFQNGMFDCTFLWEYCKIVTRGKIWDTMIVHHLIYPYWPKGLGFLTSIYTMDPYYKDESGFSSEGDVTDEQFWTYNAKDADTTYRIWFALVKRAKQEGFWDLAQFVMKMFPIFWRMSIRGIRVDVEQKNKVAEEARADIKRMEKELNVYCFGESSTRDLNVGSTKQMCEYLYDELGLPKQTTLRKDKKTHAQKRTVSADAKAIQKLTNILLTKDYPKDSPEDQERSRTLGFLKRVKEIRKLRKLEETYYSCEISADGRIRSSFSLAGPPTGRLASSAYLDETGANLQNQTKKSKTYLLPDEPDKEGPYAGIPHVLVNADGGQAEARVVAYASGERGLQHLFESGVDYHSANACNIWGYEDIFAVPGEARQLAKMGGHATNYKISDPTLAERLDIPLREAQDFKQKYFAAYPGLPAWHLAIETQIGKTRKLTNLFGRTIHYLCKIDDETIRSATAYIPQSSVNDLVNRGILNFLSRWPSAVLLLQCHDSTLWSVPVVLVDEFIRAMRPALELTICVKPGVEFVIPADFEVGYTYGSMHRYLPPEQEGEVRERLRSVGSLDSKEQLDAWIKDTAQSMGVNKDAVASIQKGWNWRELIPADWTK